MTTRARWTEDEYLSEIKAFLNFDSPFAGLADTLTRHIFDSSGDWTRVSDLQAYAERKAIAWLRHNATEYDASYDDEEALFELGPEALAHKLTCEVCKVDQNCRELTRINEEEVSEDLELRRDEHKRNFNPKARGLLYQHRRGGKHAENCTLCSEWGPARFG